MSTFARAKQDVREFVAGVMKEYHGELVDAGVTVSVLMVNPTEKEIEKGDAPYLRLNGYQAAAVVKVTSYEERVKGVEDVTLKLDRITWEKLDESERVALIDHEGEHLSLALDKDGILKTDDCGRPKLNIILHDIIIGGFRSIIDRHGIKALEAQQLRDVFADYQQRLFDWASDMAEPDKVPTVAFGKRKAAHG